jgi:hypothetical protein
VLARCGAGYDNIDVAAARGEPPLFPVPGLAADGAELVQSERRSGQDEQAGETR